MSEEEIKDTLIILEDTDISTIDNAENVDLRTYQLAVNNLLDLYNKEKEKNKELEDCLQMAKQIITVDISEDFDYMELEQFKKYLLNEIKINENLEE